jgi:hypothetical protein
VISTHVSKQVLVSNSSILLALEQANLLAPLFALPLEISITDLLYEREVKDYNGPALKKLGLCIHPLTAEIVASASAQNRSIAPTLCRDETQALILAEQSSLSLLGSHPTLARIAKAQNVPYFWLKELLLQLLEQQLLSDHIFHQRIHNMHTSVRCPFIKDDVSALLGTRLTPKISR